ncbi:hypothetical protein IVB12_16080 [Bradyrhizobium sp. 179]|uniref:hypothetical protein n=1 Tax=Bradyrhizobium sp. 179 TaxID=2782648 RepID=UPI001FF9D9F3|nr:hypothetical protein [Bradyrhizobium sp. 179]MCK1543436.1 hypothetical protein [Bradyrhizobium sp. 179]
MLVCYDDKTGMINQCIIQAPVTLEELAKRYEEMGVPHVMVDWDSPDDIFTHYVKNGQMIEKPPIELSGENRVVKADGVDTLTFQVWPPNAAVKVFFGDTPIHEETLTDGTIEFSIDHPGSYRIDIGAEFPWLGTSFTVEAV